ncbi:MAG: Bbp16 family capsid cement protein [Alphaproteobacteria bacterium]
MLSDNLVAFVPVGAPLSLVSGVGDVSSYVIDLLGSGEGTTPRAIIGNASLFGEDAGIGSNRPELNVTIGDAVVSGGGGTVNFKLMGAPDTAVTHLAGTYVVLGETGPMAVASLTAAAIVARFPFLPAVPASARPRYLRLTASIATAAVTAGTIASALVTTYRDDQANKFAPANYTV